MNTAHPILQVTANCAIVGEAFFATAGSNDLGKLFQRITWVGGRITLYPDSVFFEANALNRSLNARFVQPGRYDEYAQMYEYGILLRNVQQLHLRSWWGRKFIQLDTTGGLTMGIVPREVKRVHREIAALLGGG